MLSQIEKDLKFESFRKLHSLLQKKTLLKTFLVALEVKLCFYNVNKISSQWLVSKYFSDFIDTTCVSLVYVEKTQYLSILVLGEGVDFGASGKAKCSTATHQQWKPRYDVSVINCFVIENKH